MISLESKSNYELYRELQYSLDMTPQVGEIILLRDIVKDLLYFKCLNTNLCRLLMREIINQIRYNKKYY
jgi:hypothetical protein